MTPEEAKAVLKLIPGAYCDEGLDWDQLVLQSGHTTEELRNIVDYLDKEGAITIRDTGIRRAWCLECYRPHRMGTKYCLL